MKKIILSLHLSNSLPPPFIGQPIFDCILLSDHIGPNDRGASFVIVARKTPTSLIMGEGGGHPSPVTFIVGREGVAQLPHVPSSSLTISEDGRGVLL